MRDIKERRKHIRANKPYTVSLRVQSNEYHETSPTDWEKITIHNLSVHSIFFYYGKTLAIGSILDLKINIPKTTTTINCTGRVALIRKHLNSFLTGIAAIFTDMDEEEKGVIEKSILEG